MSVEAFGLSDHDRDGVGHVASGALDVGFACDILFGFSLYALCHEFSTWEPYCGVD